MGEGTVRLATNLESHIERWTVMTQGTLVPGISRHCIRINPGEIDQSADEGPNCGTLILANQSPNARLEFPAKEISLCCGLIPNT